MSSDSKVLLSDVAVRILGVLIEKEKTTPDNYPLTLNSLLLACNQTTNRNPVVNYDEMTVERGLTELRDAGLALRGVYAGSRVPKHRHCANEFFGISNEALAVLAVLLLRGEQTLGEIKQRTERLFDFGSLDECNNAIDELEKLNFPLVVRLPKSPGHKEPRIAHLLSEQSSTAENDSEQNIARPSFKLIEGEKSDDLQNDVDDEYGDSYEELERRVEILEKETTVLTHEIMSLRAEIDEMRDPSA